MRPIDRPREGSSGYPKFTSASHAQMLQLRLTLLFALRVLGSGQCLTAVCVRRPVLRTVRGLRPGIAADLSGGFVGLERLGLTPHVVGPRVRTGGIRRLRRILFELGAGRFRYAGRVTVDRG